MKFDDEAAYESHDRDAHQLQCPQCSKLFKNTHDFFNHAITHAPISKESATAPKIVGLYENSDCASNQAVVTSLVHTPILLFGCVQCTQTFPTSDAAAAHYATEHAFICEACPGTFFINSATRERHFITCGNISETSDSGESFQTSRTEFSPLMQRRALLPAIRVPPSSAVPLVQFHEEPLSPAQPLFQIYEKSAIERINAAQELARKILAEANARPQATYSCQRCSPLVEI
ncbi:hypothetical protein BELL_0240g00110 [Botrytis elliptica]|uniref:C2H2-type domain-containing protein n=1 Tax=Botrytis elliptica TaxID=278938 RepID=A0A4Z1JN86_9HELO|nr:hypothetical protein BELL_0240g00110 [Botrytis elliptica]